MGKSECCREPAANGKGIVRDTVRVMLGIKYV